MIQPPAVSYVRLFFRGWGLFPPVLLFAGSLFLLGGLSLGRDADLLERYGVEAVGEVTDRRIERSTDSDGRTTTRHYLIVSYTPPNRDPLTARRSVSRAEYERIENGTPQTLRYVEHDPRIVEFAAGQTRGGSRVLTSVAVALLLLCAFFVVLQLRKVRSVHRAVTYGEAREARVTDNGPTNVRVNRAPLHRLAWVDARGATGTSATMPARRAMSFPAGTVITVWEDPRTGRTWWQEDIAPGSAARGTLASG